MLVGLAIIIVAFACFNNAQYLSLLSVRSGSPLQFQPVVASELGLWLGKESATYCPPKPMQEGLCSANDDGTNFVYNGAGQLAMGTEVPGGQQVFIDPACGAVNYTVAHSNVTPGGAILNGWEYSSGQSYGFMSWNDGVTGAGGFFACAPSGNSNIGPWQIFVELGGVEFGDECLGFDMITSNETAPAAWEYV